MEKECECYEEEVQPYRKADYKLIIYVSEIFGNIYSIKKVGIHK